MSAHRLLCPWDSSGKNTGVGCHFLLQVCMCVCVVWVQSLLVREQDPTCLMAKTSKHKMETIL